MKASLNILIAYFMVVTACSAQRSQSVLELYSHTINYPSYKVVFHLEVVPEGHQATSDSKRYFWYGGNQINITQGGFGGKLLDGAYREFYLNKNLKAEGNFDGGLMVGEWKKWRENGSLDSISNYSSGELNGLFARFDGKGILLEEGRYRNGLKHRKWLGHLSTDKVQVTYYKKGIVIQEKQSKLKIWMIKLGDKIKLRRKK
ncbi:hypothetical protein EZ449_15370 [Pedobacter frigidisoli]|uniref:MORN repeat variant n=1 Tax=Pedobacter frigidisoli TaxID=2530455 RepID=A0A4R0NZ74_9SPHI|nr:hypothetical protein [Pedobacter frigidisoli]TCD05843.1 hypothetical protein EZ449_15370 [Pedobacter frigidisoli]